MTIKLQDIYGLAKVKIGDLFSSPPAGTSQSITSGAPADVPLELTPAAGQTAALLRASGHDIIDKSGSLILPPSAFEEHLIVDVPFNTNVKGGGVTKGTWYTLPLPAAESALAPGLYLLFVNGYLSGYHSASVGIMAPQIKFAAVPNTTLPEYRFSAAVGNSTALNVPFSLSTVFTVTAGSTADFTFANYVQMQQSSGSGNLTSLTCAFNMKAIKLKD